MLDRCEGMLIARYKAYPVRHHLLSIGGGGYIARLASNRSTLPFLAIEVATLGGVAHEVTLTAIFEAVEDGWTQARIRELPEVITAAPTRDEAEESLKDALLEYLSTLGQPLEGELAVGERQDLHLTVA